MSVKPVSADLASLFAVHTTALFVKSGESSGAKAAKTLFQPAASKAPADEVSLSAQALAALKGGTGMVAGQPLSATASQAVSKPAPLSSQAAGAAKASAPMGGQAESATPPLRIDGMIGAPAFDPNAHAEMSAYFNERMAHSVARNTMLRSAFKLPEVDGGGGLMLTGNITKAIDRTMQKDGAVLPEKPASLLAREQANAMAASGVAPTPMPEGTASTSMITLFLPGSQGSGDEQVEILFDDKAMAKLAALSPDAVKAGLTDMMADTDAARAGTAAMTGGTLGAFIAENGDRHSEYAAPKARYGVFDPDQEGGQPMLMIQSKSRPDYVRQHAGDLVDAVMGLLRGLAPAVNGGAASGPSPTA